MSIATAVSVAVGKADPYSVYVKIKNKNVYKFNQRFSNADVLVARIKERGQITISAKNWTKVEAATITPDQPASVITWAESAAIDDGPAPCLSIGDPANAFPPSSSDAWKHTTTPALSAWAESAVQIADRGWLVGGEPLAPRFQYFAQFKAKCNKLAAEGNLGALQDLYDAKERKAHALRTQFEVFQKTMHDTESDWEELDRIQRVMDVVEAERDYASDAAHSAWEANS